MNKIIDEKVKKQKQEDFATLFGAIGVLIVIVGGWLIFREYMFAKDVLLAIKQYPVIFGLICYYGVIFLFGMLHKLQGIIKNIVDCCMFVANRRILTLPLFLAPFVSVFIHYGFEGLGIVIAMPFMLIALWLGFCFHLFAKGFGVTMATRIAKGEDVFKEGLVEESIGYGVAVDILQNTLKK